MLEYQAGVGIGPAAIQAEGQVGPGEDKHGWGVEGGVREIMIPTKYSVKAIIGIKLEVKKK